MDVSPWIWRFCFSGALICVLVSSGCGNRFDLNTERGRRARIDEANFHLSTGNCSAALEAISHLYNSAHVDDEVRIVTASAYACGGTFKLLSLLTNMSGASNFFQVMAKSLTNVQNDGARTAFYNAVDVLTQNGNALNASQRSTSVNNYMVFLQLGVMGSIMRNYGSPTSAGAQGADLVYDGAGGSPAGEMSDLDACALAAALSHLSDSFSNSTLTDADSSSVNTALNAVCVAAGQASCAAINRDRTACNGNNAASVVADAVVDGVNSGW